MVQDDPTVLPLHSRIRVKLYRLCEHSSGYHGHAAAIAILLSILVLEKDVLQAVNQPLLRE